MTPRRPQNLEVPTKVPENPENGGLCGADLHGGLLLLFGQEDYGPCSRNWRILFRRV